MRSWSGSLRLSTRPGTATTSRPSGSTRRNSRSRRLGDSEHDRGERAGAFAAARQAYLAPGADQDRISQNRIRRVQPGTSHRGGSIAAAVGRADADVRLAHRGGPGGRHRQREVLTVQRPGRGELLARGRDPADHQALARLRVGVEGAAPLLDWLGVQRRHRYARASALDEGEASLTGMLLLDLPDHDSVVTGSAALVDRLVKMADMLVWVLDPLKYADASVHRRYLMPLAGHAAVTTVVLNQVDTLSPDQADDCRSDLRRLLDAEGLSETQVLVTSATTGAGLDELRRVLANAVAVRQAAAERITADIDALLERFAVYAGASVPGWLSPASRAPTLTLAPAVASTLQSPQAEPAPAQGPTRPPWELDDGGESESNGRVGAADWQPWQTSAAPTKPASSARPPWERSEERRAG